MMIEALPCAEARHSLDKFLDLAGVLLINRLNGSLELLLKPHHIRHVHVQKQTGGLRLAIGSCLLHRLLLCVDLHREFWLHDFLTLAASCDQTEPPAHILKVQRASLVLSLQNVTHLGQTTLQQVEESFLEILFESHSLKDGSEGLRSGRVHLRDVKDAVGERLHGHLKVVVL